MSAPDATQAPTPPKGPRPDGCEEEVYRHARAASEAAGLANVWQFVAEGYIREGARESARMALEQIQRATAAAASAAAWATAYATHASLLATWGEMTAARSTALVEAAKVATLHSSLCVQMLAYTDAAYSRCVAAALVCDCEGAPTHPPRS